jgi:hypothetical protein
MTEDLDTGQPVAQQGVAAVVGSGLSDWGKTNRTHSYTHPSWCRRGTKSFPKERQLSAM